MGIARLVKEGWFDKSSEIDLDLTDQEIAEIKTGKEIIVSHRDGFNYSVQIPYLATGGRIDMLEKSDIRIRQIAEQKSFVAKSIEDAIKSVEYSIKTLANDTIRF
jgi:hypothetical protein